MSAIPKTPISILQEMMVKKGQVPKYQLIHDGGGTHENTFTWSVACEGLVAKGTGRCKKTAKHIAANKMLELIADTNGFLALPPTPADSPVRTPKSQFVSYIVDPSQPFLNAIGALQDLCAENELSEPIYDVINDIGPPHARIFTVQCTVSGFKEEGTATTKKQAKHDAAFKMYEKIGNVLSDISSNVVEISEVPDLSTVNDDTAQIHEKIKKLFLELSKNKISRKANLGVTISKYHEKMIERYGIELRQQVNNELNELIKIIDCKSYQDPLEFNQKCIKEMQKILEQMELELDISIMTGEDKKFVISLYINAIPSITELSVSNDAFDALIQVCSRAIETFQILLF
ncbi:hypothetical protein HCN44_005986 [Aphidius gifuensis]|uniref:DRBM domain-containing protein n=1 Tax=Aphidius gifuensis TaxID=684658 RepID=A0A835CY97_APHGI|nr:RISC-loading complex subunit tarbp2-like [Aphidius gifuensis]KAF7997415.1 hypothetical protein HCN44_005986 [Aphidius gifuensis]